MGHSLSLQEQTELHDNSITLNVFNVRTGDKLNVKKYVNFYNYHQLLHHLFISILILIHYLFIYFKKCQWRYETLDYTEKRMNNYYK